MKSQRGKKAEHCSGHPLRDFCVGMMFRRWVVGQRVHAATRPFEFSLPTEAQKVFTRNAGGLNVPWAHDAVLSDVSHRFKRISRHGRLFQYVTT